MQQVEKNREIVAWIALGAAIVNIVVGFIAMLAVGEGLPESMKPEFGQKASAASSYFGAWPLLLVGAVATWLVVFWRRPSANAKLVGLVGLIVSGAYFALNAIFGLLALGSDHLEALGRFRNILNLVAELAVTALFVGFFYIAWKHTQGVAGGQPQQFGGPQAQPQPQSQPQNQPTWQPDQASGGAWNRADDAATGAAASAWGTPGSQNQGWQPSASQQPSAAPQPSANQPTAQQWQQPHGYGQQPQQPADQWAQSQHSADHWGQQQNQQTQWGNQDAEGTVLRPNPNQGSPNQDGQY